jgi:hypothetical protein
MESGRIFAEVADLVFDREGIAPQFTLDHKWIVGVGFLLHGRGVRRLGPSCARLCLGPVLGFQRSRLHHLPYTLIGDFEHGVFEFQ